MNFPLNDINNYPECHSDVKYLWGLLRLCLRRWAILQNNEVHKARSDTEMNNMQRTFVIERETSY